MYTIDQLRATVADQLGIARPNPMQDAVWASEARRMIVISPTGSGKTVAFIGAMLRRIGEPDGSVQALVLAPSRELVIQIYEVARKMARGYKVAAFYGQHSMADEVATMAVVPDIIVATPGRMLDHIQRRTADIADLRVLVIDEYDKCLEMGFHEEMKRITARLHRVQAVILTSATPLKERPDFIDLDAAETVDFTPASENPQQRISIARVESAAKDKLQTLDDLLRSLHGGKVMVFVNHRESAERLYKSLREAGLPVGLYHGGLDQLDRERAVIQLDNGTTPIMIATDLAARGLDIDSVGTVIHYHLPVNQEAWTHRNGRTARVDASGAVYVITSEADNIPEYVVWDRDYNPTGASPDPIRRSTATLHINAGRKEKISRGDIVGFLINNLGLEASQIGKIDLRDHMAYVAIPRSFLGAVAALQQPKIKGKRVRITKFE
ncbi:MAG: DEAD/DEAH box helicase [Muribaculaceae bacterium]|nr:DEAD/DEAH box helicase [Muribaculaceae bacterium]